MKGMIFLALLGLAACADQDPLGIVVDPHKPLGADFGNAVQTNINAQVVNPTPNPTVADTDGRRIENAIHRYETNRVYQPQPEAAGALNPTVPTSPQTGGPSTP